MNLFFFYGSLRTGYWNQRILSKSARKIGDAQTVQPFELYVGKRGHVPTCVPVEQGNVLHGELYELNDVDARRVEQLETGYNVDYFDVVVGGETHTARIYHHTSPEDCSYLRGGHFLVPTGDYTSVVSKTGELIG